MATPETTDLDRRLARFAGELDEQMPDVATLARRATDAAPAGGDLALAPEVATSGVPTPAPPSRRVWLATAAAVVLLVAGSLVWVRSVATTDLDVTTPDVTVDEAPSGPDGTAPLPPRWEASDLSTTMSSPMAVVPFGDGLLAVGSDDVVMPVSWSSADGMTWGPETRMADVGGIPRSIATDGTIAVAVGMAPGTAMAWVTADGATWERHALPGASKLNAVAHTADGFLAVGAAVIPNGEAADTIGPAAWRSDDGRTWTVVDLPVGGAGEARDVAAVGDVIVIAAVESGRPLVLTFRDMWWRARLGSNDEEVLMAPGELNAVTTQGDGFVAVGARDGRASMWTSPDGMNWSSRSVDEIPEHHPSGQEPIVTFRDVAATDRTVLVIPNSTQQGLDGFNVWASIDGGAWVETLGGANRVSPWGDRFVAIGLALWLSSERPGQ